MNCSDCKFYIEDGKDINEGICRGVRVPAKRPSSECPQRSFQRRIEKWLNDDYKEMFEQLQKKVLKFYREKNDQGLFTLHDQSHCVAVEKMEKVLVSKSNVDFSALERFLLSCAAWTHDLGMSEEISDLYFKELEPVSSHGFGDEIRRKEHHNISSWYLQKESSWLFKKDGQENVTSSNEQFSAITLALASIIRFHRKAEDIDECEEWTSIKGEVVRLKLLSSILRLADTLHKDVTRFDRSTYAFIKVANFGRISRLHWLKSLVISNIHLCEFEQVITLHLKLPDYKHFISLTGGIDYKKFDKLKADWEQRVQNLEYIISTDIEEDLLTVNGIFAAHKMPTYVKVNIDVAYIRGFSKEYYSDIDSVLSELDILFSPNTSKVISRTLDSLKAFSTAKFHEPNIFWSQFEQLAKYLNSIYKDRPCHAGLGWLMKIIKEFKEEKFGSNIKEAQKALESVVEKIITFRKSAKRKICDKAHDIIHDDVTDIFVIGFSSTVLEMLETYSSQKANALSNTTVHVMECSTKRRLVHSNLIEYSDGAHYAIKIGKLNSFKTKLIPDFGFATLINSMRENFETDEDLKKRCLVLFGANGIDEKTGDCGHTSGHLMVAIVAKKFKIPVKIVSDSFKVGEIKWNHNAIRKGDWFATQKNIINDLSDAHVNIINMREDRIPCNLITEIHTEDNCLSEDQNGCEAESLNKISSVAKDFYKELIDILNKQAEPNATPR